MTSTITIEKDKRSCNLNFETSEKVKESEDEEMETASKNSIIIFCIRLSNTQFIKSKNLIKISESPWMASIVIPSIISLVLCEVVL